MLHCRITSSRPRKYCNPYCNRAGMHWYTMDKVRLPDRRKPPKQARFPDAPVRARTHSSKLVTGAGVSGSSPLVGSLVCADLQVKREGKVMSQDHSWPNLQQAYCNPFDAGCSLWRWRCDHPHLRGPGGRRMPLPGRPPPYLFDG